MSDDGQPIPIARGRQTPGLRPTPDWLLIDAEASVRAAEVYAAFLVSRFETARGDHAHDDKRQLVPAELIAQLAAAADEMRDVTRRAFALMEPGMVDNADHFVQIARARVEQRRPSPGEHEH